MDPKPDLPQEGYQCDLLLLVVGGHQFLIKSGEIRLQAFAISLFNHEEVSSRAPPLAARHELCHEMASQLIEAIYGFRRERLKPGPGGSFYCQWNDSTGYLSWEAMKGHVGLQRL